MKTKQTFRDHLYYEVGEEKLLDELDGVSIIKAIRQLRILTQLLLSKQQKFLIKFQRNNVIDSSSSGTSDEGNENIVGLLKGNNARHKEIVYQKIHDNISGYRQRTFSTLDRRIFKGIFKKRFSDKDDDDDADSDSNGNLNLSNEIEERKEDIMSDNPKYSSTGSGRIETLNSATTLPKIVSSGEPKTGRLSFKRNFERNSEEFSATKVHHSFIQN